MVFAACDATPATPSSLPTPITAIACATSSSTVRPVVTPAPTASIDEDVLFAYDYEPVQGDPGGTAVIGDWQAVLNLNPYYDASPGTAQVRAATMRGLWITTADGRWKPDLAAKMPRFSDSSIRQAADGSFEVDLELRPDLAWSDGTPLTLNDLRFTWQWVMDPAQVGLVGGTSGWEDIGAIDVSSNGRTATVRFERPYPGFYALLGNAILPEHYFSSILPPEARSRSMPVGPAIRNVPTSGPFRFEDASSTGVELVRNPNWVGGAFNHGAYLDAVSFRYFAGKGDLIDAFLAGDLDVALNLSADDFASLRGVHPSAGEAIIEPAWEYEYLGMNQGPDGHPMLADIDVRRAIFRAIDRSALYGALFPGFPVPSSPACSPAPPGTFWRDESLQCPGFDPAAAAATLAAAGWIDSNGDGTIDKDGREAVLEACTTAGNQTRVLALQRIADDLRSVGIRIDIATVDRALIVARWADTTPKTRCSLYRGTYDIVLFGWLVVFDMFDSYYFPYHSAQWPDADPHDGLNFSRFSDPAMDAALLTLRNSIDTTARLSAGRAVQRLFVDRVAEIPLYYRASTRGVSIRLANFVTNPSAATDVWNVEDWFVR
jgi:peptide/nickel transport system substrate-binding protein